MFKFAAVGLVNKAILPEISTWIGKGLFCVQSGAKGQCRHMSEKDSTSNHPSFQYCWEPGSGYYGDSLGKTGRYVHDICEDFLLSHLGKMFMNLLFWILNGCLTK